MTLVLVLEGRWHEARAFAPSNNNSHAIALGSGRHLGRPRTDGLDTTDRPPLCSRKRQQILQASLTKELSSLTVVELKGLLKAQGCTVSGRKAELIQRLESAFAVDDVIAEGISNSSSSTPILVKKRPAVRQRKEKQQQLPPKKKAVSIVDANLDEEFDSIFGQTPSPGQSSAHSDASSLVAAPDDVHPLTPKTVLEKNNGFSNMCLPRPVLRQLSKMNIEEPTPIQRDSIPVALDGIDVMGLAQTGTGKTLAFGIPLVSKLLDGSDNDARSKRNVLSPGGVSALVLAPTRELANQIAEQLQSLTAGTPISTMAVYGGGPRVQTQANKLKKGTHILVATPGRLIDLLDRGAISLRDCRFLTLDEADHSTFIRLNSLRGRSPLPQPIGLQKTHKNVALLLALFCCSARYGICAESQKDCQGSTSKPPDNVIFGNHEQKHGRSCESLSKESGTCRGGACGYDSGQDYAGGAFRRKDGQNDKAIIAHEETRRRAHVNIRADEARDGKTVQEAESCRCRGHVDSWEQESATARSSGSRL